MRFSAPITITAIALLLNGCDGLPYVPVAPTVVTPTAGPDDARILLAGQSNAFGLRECCMRAAPALLAVAPVQRWLAWPEFAEAARNPELIAFVWWQGAADAQTPADDYIAQLRQVIAIARAANANLPVRIIELPNLPDRARVRAAQQVVAGDPGVELISTADLPPPDADGHFSAGAYQTVRERIYRSIGR